MRRLCRWTCRPGGRSTTKARRRPLLRVLLRVLRSSAPELGSLGLGTAALFVNSITNLYFPYAIGECPGREGVEKSGKI